MKIVISIKQTCSACPSQWEGRLIDGDYIYVRYRWGGLGVGIGKTRNTAILEDSFYKSIGDSLDGFLSYEELKEHTKDEFSWPVLCEDSEIL